MRRNSLISIADRLANTLSSRLRALEQQNAALLDAAKEIREQQAASVNQHQTVSEQHQRQYESVISALGVSAKTLTEAIGNHSDDQKEKHPLQKLVLAWLTFTAATVAAGAAYYSLAQSVRTADEMAKQTPSIKQSADAAAIAADTARRSAEQATDAYHVERRAWLSPAIQPPVEPWSVVAGQPIRFSVSFKNIGPTPARNVVGDINHRLIPAGALPATFDYSTNHRVGPVGAIFPNGSGFLRTLGHTDMTKDEEDALRQGRIVLFVWGYQIYEDIFSFVHAVTFCYTMEAVNRSSQPFVVSMCPFYNYAD
jgi:hypothetical protein